MILRYSELSPEQLEEAIAASSLAICPWGALEWQGSHLPLGAGGLIAESFCARLAEAAGAVLLPCNWLPIAGIPHRLSLAVPAGVLGPLWSAWLDELVRIGFRTICIVTGHYSPGHEVEMYNAAEQAMLRHEGTRVIAASPLEVMLAPEMQDHAGRYTTAQLLALRPDLVHLDRYQDGGPAENAVLGDNPLSATAEEGAALLENAVLAWRSVLEKWDIPTLFYFYEKRLRAYRAHREQYFQESWEQAAADWWKDTAGG